MPFNDNADFKLASEIEFNKSTLYSNCIVEVWENTETGAVSWGWYKTPETQVVEE